MREPRVPASWSEHGASFGRDGLLYLADWRRGFTCGELRALFFECQRVRSLESSLRIAKSDLEKLEVKMNDLEKRCAFYRRQCVLEAQLGLALSRLT